MRTPPVRIVPSPATRRRVWLVLFAFATLNAVWSLVGSWSVQFGGETYRGRYVRTHGSGVASSGGYLVVALRESVTYGGGAVPIPLDDDLAAGRLTPVSWGVHGQTRVGPGAVRYLPHNGILWDDPQRIAPGLIVNWQDPAGRGRWYNRGIAIHWVLLGALAGVPVVVGLVRGRGRGFGPGRCAGCGYDLRGTPDRCPECGREPEGVVGGRSPD